MKLPDDCAIWLYGSHARGDSDQLSDVDVLVVSNEAVDSTLIPTELRVRNQLAIARYSWGEIEGMARYGSLFLQHLRLEGRTVLEGPRAKDRLRDVLGTLAGYTKAKQDLAAFRAVLTDVRESVVSIDCFTFELATVATVFRHACILGCSLAGSPCFSRIGPIARLVGAWSLAPNWLEEFPVLYAYRMYAEGRSLRPEPAPRRMIERWCSRADRLLHEIRYRNEDRQYGQD